MASKVTAKKRIRGMPLIITVIRFYKPKATLHFAGETYQVTGDAWLDREWSSALIDPSQNGWDWFSIQADDKKQGGLMAFCIRNGKQKL